MGKERVGELIAKSLTVLQDADFRSNAILSGAPVASLFMDGEVFYVDPGNGNDSYTGKEATAAFATMQTAIDACVDGRGDVIIRLPGTETVTETITFDKGGVVVMASTYGLNPLANGEYFATLADETFTDGPVATITAQCTVAGLGFVSRDAGATFFSGAAMLIGGAAAGAFGVHILNCRFPKWGVDNRIGIALAGGEAVADVLIEGCSFEGVGSDFDSGIYVQGAIQNLEVRENRFRDCTYAITHGAFAGGGPHCMYIENVCEDSKLLETGSNDATGLIAGNYLEGATDTGSYDVTVDDANALGLVFSGNHYAE